MKHVRWMSLVVAAGLAASPALAQDGAKAAEPVKEAPKAPAKPVFTDPEIESIANALAGHWQSSMPVPTGEGDMASPVVISLAPVTISDLPNAMYCEVARQDALRQPYRQTVWAFQRVGGKVRLTTFEFRTPEGVQRGLIGLWAVPQAFPAITRKTDLVATLAFDVTGSGGTFEGKTPHAYPTGMGNAVEMTGQFRVTKDTLETADRGFGADGKQTWGPDAGKGFAFKRVKSPVTTTEVEPGLFRLDYPAELSGEAMKQGEVVKCHYTGYLLDGKMFDSSYQRGQPFTYTVGQPIIEGWNKSMATARAGQRSRVIIPSAMGYGERGRRGVIPPNSTLIFDLDIISIEPPPPPAPAPAPEGTAPKTAEPVKDPAAAPK